MKRGAVAAGDRQTASIAADVLGAGGNAFDAAIAGFFAACVAEPVLASPGGGGFMLVHSDRGDALFDFFTQTPVSKDLDKPLDFQPVTVDFGRAQQEFHIGLGSSATPGCIRGMFEIHRQLGSMPMRELMAPAVELAREGFVLNELQAYILGIVAPIYMTESARSLFAGPRDTRQVAKNGDRLRFPGLADFLEVLAIEGEALFYEGEIARSVVESCRNGGGYLDYPDLKNYQVYTRQVLRKSYRGCELITNPPPNAGGILIAFGLGLLEPHNLSRLKFGSYDHLRLLAEVFLATSRARLDHFTDTGVVDLLQPHLLERYQQEVAGSTMAARGTTHVSVVDAGGNVAAMTVSNGEGCGFIVPDTGFMLNNMLGEQDLHPQGFHIWDENQRMSSMMAPSILRTENSVMALGSGGSNRIRTTMLQVISNLIDFATDLEPAVTHSRLHIEDSVLNLEGGFDESVVQRLIGDFPDHRLFDDINMFFGGCHIAALDQGGDFQAVGDPRRNGVGVVV